MVTIRRRLGGAAFGLVYGGTFVNGLYRGLAFVSGKHYSDMGGFLAGRWPWLTVAIYWLSAVLSGLLGSYVGRSIVSGSAASGIASGLLITAPGLLFFGFQPAFSTVVVLAVASFAVGTILASLSSHLPVSQSDLDFGRVIGVSWRHWLWLWLPFQYVVANVIWLGTPRFLLTGGKPDVGIVVTHLGDVLNSTIGACVVAYAGFRAVDSLRADASLTRAQSVVRFAFWFSVAPVLVNLWRLFL